MKRPLRLLLILAGSFAGLLALLVGLAFTPAVQTWAVRRAVAGVPGVKIELGRTALGLRSVRLENVRVEQPGLVLTLPAAEVELPLLDAIKGRVAISRLVAKGWTLDLTGAAPAKPAAPAGAFEGVFKFLKLPVALTLEHTELEGDVTQPGGKTHVTLSGGGLAPDKEATFKFTTGFASTAADAPVKSASATGDLIVGLDGPDAIKGFALNADAIASGPKISGEAKTRLTVWARRDAKGGENYAVIVRSGTRELVNLEAGLPAAGGALAGKWSVDAGDADLAPLRQFLPDGPLPAFAAKGQGTFSASRDLKDFSAAGKISGNADKLDALRAELAAMGRVEFAAEFDAEQRGGMARVAKLSLALGGAAPVATVETLQAFEFDRTKKQLVPTNPAADLARASLNNLPLAWAQPWLPKNLLLTGSLGGSAVVSARDGGFAARVTDFTVREGRAVNAGQTVWQGGVNSPAASFAQSPQGWQAEISSLTLTAGGAGQTLAGIRVAQAAGAGQPLSFELKDGAMDLAVLRQLSPSLAPQLPASGTARFSAAGSLSEKKQVALKLALAGVTAGSQRQALPDATLDLRADIAADGRITASAPVTLTSGARKSDLTLGGTFTPTKAGWNFDAQAAGDTVFVDDLKALAALAPESSAPKTAGPPWAGLAGTVKFSVKRVVFSADYASSLAGTLTVAAGGVTLDTRGALDGATAAPFTLKAGVTHTPGGAMPYALAADAELNNFTLGALRRTLEAEVRLAVHLTSRAASPDRLAQELQGKLQLSSKGGVTHLLEGSQAVLTQSLGAGAKVVGVGASIFGALTGSSTASTMGAVSNGVGRVADLLQSIRFDQLNVLLSRDATNDLVLEEFTLVSPEVRLAGKGRVTSVPGKELAELPLALTFQLAARGSVGDGLRGLGLVAAKADSLGYFPLAFEPEIGGTVGNPDKAPFYNQLAQHALTSLVGGAPAPVAPKDAGAEKPGVGGLLKDAAGGLLNGFLK